MPPSVTGTEATDETDPFVAVRRPLRLPMERLVSVALVAMRFVKMPVTALRAVATRFEMKELVVVALVATRLVVVAYVMERFVVEVAMTDGKQFASEGPQGCVAVPGSVVSPGEKGVVRAAARERDGARAMRRTKIKRRRGRM